MFFLYFWAVRVALQALNHLIDLSQLAWNADVLRTVGLALAALDAVIGLTEAWHYPIERDEILAAMLALLGITHSHGQRALVLALVVVYKDGRDINAVRTRHAVFTVVARNILKAYNLLGYLFVEVAHLLVGKRLERTI